MTQGPIRGPFNIGIGDARQVLSAEGYLVAECGSQHAAQWLCDTLNRSIPTPPPAGERENATAAVIREKMTPSVLGTLTPEEATQLENFLAYLDNKKARASLLTTPSYQDGVEAAAKWHEKQAEAYEYDAKATADLDQGWHRDCVSLALTHREQAKMIRSLTPSTAGKETT